MSFLKGRVILILSPQSWGTMFLSKHHYAVALAEKGNEVYFLNPPVTDNSLNKGDIVVRKIPVHTNLYLIDHRLPFSYNIRFHWVWLFHYLMKFHLQQVVKEIGKNIDIIWSFDLNNLYPFHLLSSNAIKVFHPVDEPLNDHAIHSAKGAGVIFSVTNEILDKYKKMEIPRIFIHHGVTETFINDSVHYKRQAAVNVGFSGNLLRKDIDWETLLQIVKENAPVQFHFWGSYKIAESNIGGSDTTNIYLKQLHEMKNVTLYGAVSPEILAKSYAQMDTFLICYDINKDQSGGTNYHKVMEFLATGKVIVSNNLTTYQGTGLLEMSNSRHNNAELPALFKKVITNLDVYNADAMMQQRIAFARSNTYPQQIDRIASHLAGLFIRESNKNSVEA